MKTRVIAVLAVTALVAVGCGSSDNKKKGDNLTGTLSLMSAGEQNEVDAYQSIFDDLINSKVKYKAQVESVSDFEQQFQIRAKSGTLQVAAAPQPGALPKLADAGQIVSLEDLGMDIDALNNLVGKSFMDLGVYKGKHWGLPTNVNLKSMIWYPKKAFDAKGYQVPKTWDEMLALSAKIKSDGSTPWCVGFESGGATGWPATDWLEDIMLRTAGPDTYDKWYKHEIPFNDPAIKAAATTFGEIRDDATTPPILHCTSSAMNRFRKSTTSGRLPFLPTTVSSPAYSVPC
jgi:alpha-glucoside transport system substrate-binding protein